MNRIDIEKCTDIEELKKLCFAYRKATFCIGETLVDESKQHITIEQAKDEIRKYLREMNNAEDAFVRKMEEPEDDLKYKKLKVGDRLEVIKSFVSYPLGVYHKYEPGDIFSIQKIFPFGEGYIDPNKRGEVRYVLAHITSLEDFFHHDIRMTFNKDEIFEYFKVLNWEENYGSEQ